MLGMVDSSTDFCKLQLILKEFPLETGIRMSKVGLAPCHYGAGFNAVS